MKKWKKLGLIIRPDPGLWWMQTHAMVPTPEHLAGSVYRIYFSGRDKKNRSHIGYAVIDLKDPTKLLDLSKEPVLAPGALGCFDDNGVTPSCIVRNGNETFLYYIGWNPGSTTRMNIFGGLAIRKGENAPFVRHSRAPILERINVNPYINTAPFAVRNSPDDWTIYYVSAVEWVSADLPRYNIQMGKSRDGKSWVREGRVCIDFCEGENAIARPYVIKEDGLFKMWFASKGKNYRIRYAESTDGISWTRRDDLFAFSPTPGTFDSEMTEYGVVVRWDGKRYMFYNGNNYGAGGIGLAVED